MSDTSGTLITCGYRARREGRLQEAKEFFSKAAESSRAAADPTLLAQSLRCLGQIERDLKNTAAALQHYQDAASLCRGLPDPLRLAHTVRHVADILRQEGSLDKAVPFYEEALQIYRRHTETDALELANAIRGFALLKGQAGRTEEARSLWQEAKSLYASVGVQPGVKESDLHLASLDTNSDR